MKWLTIILILGAAWSCKTITENGPPSNQASQLSFLASDTTLNAGTPFEIMFNNPDGIADVRMAVLSFEGIRWYEPEMTEGAGRFTIPGDDLRKAGIRRIMLMAFDRITDERSLKILPGSPVGLMETFAGPRTIRAGGSEPAMVAAIPLDRFGNTVDEKSSISFHAQGPQVEGKWRKAPVQGVAVMELKGSGTAGKIITGAASENSFSNAEHIQIIPEPPVPFELRSVRESHRADGQSVTRLQTPGLKDKFENSAAEGTLLRFYIYEAGALGSIYEAVAVNGSASLRLQNPEASGQWAVYASIAPELAGEPLLLSYERESSDFPISWQEDSKLLVIGPVTETMGQHTADGVRVILEIKSGEDHSIYFGALQGGFCRFDLNTFVYEKGACSITVTIGGNSKTMDIEF